MKIKVNVTQHDIDECEPNDSERCAVQRALVRVLPPGCTVRVGPDYAQIGLKGEFDLEVIPLPIEVTDFISDLDRGLDVVPLSCVLEVPDRFRRTG